jgi:hypothetical protein
MGKKDRYADYVEHPRFGRSPIPSAENIPLAEIHEYWGYRGEHIYPQTAIRADITKQNCCAFPRRVYVDIRQTCRTCGRRFIFFAQEQKHWYEVLGFYIDARCVECPECRKENQQTRRLEKRLLELHAAKKLDDEGYMELAETYTALLELGIVRKAEKITSAIGQIRDRRKYAGRAAAVKEKARQCAQRAS